ncbi:MAG: hypothetical protein ACXV6M_14325, partial [Ilumatobacteraceae bacterium]
VDIDPWVHEHIFPELYADLDVSIACHVDPVHLIRGFDEFDLCFIDADHSSPAVRADIEFVRQFDPWLIVLHDAGYPSVARAIAGETWLHINTEHGLAIGR